MKIINILLFLIIYTNFYGQNNKYKEIDLLIETELMIDAKKALTLLQQKHQNKDTLTAEYWIRYSKASFNYKQTEQAIRAINKAIDLNPNFSDNYYEKAVIANKLDILDSALKYIDQAISITPKGKYFFYRALINQQLQNLDQAEIDYNLAIQNNYKIAELYTNLAILLLKNDNIDQSLKYINEAIKINPKYAEAFSARSKINITLLNIDSACVDQETALKLGHTNVFIIPAYICNGSDIDKLEFSSNFAVSTNQYKYAILGYTQLIENSNLQSDYFLNRGLSYFKIGDYLRAEKDYLKALEFLDVSADLVFNNLSLLYFEQGNYLKSIEYSSKRIELDENNYTAYLDRGLALKSLSRFEEAAADFEKSLQIKPDFFRAFGYRGAMFLQQEQYRKAYENAKQSVDINPTYGFGYLILAQAKYMLGKPNYCDDLQKAKYYGDPEADQAIRTFCK